MHGEVLSEYKNNKEMFYSGWRAAGIGSLCCVFLLGIIFGYVYVESSTGSTGEYYDYLETFTENEEIATSLYNLLDDGNNLQVVKFIEKTALPAWRENLQIIHKISELDDLPPELKVNNELLVEYCKLRIKSCELISQSVLSGGTQYDLKLTTIHSRIEVIVDKLQ